MFFLIMLIASGIPAVFAPGVISSAAHDSAPAFTPDGATVYFTRSSAAASVILVSRKIRSGWSQPAVAPFSGTWLDMEPTMAPDGSYLVFVSNRPNAANGKPLDGTNLWRVERTPSGWAQPVRLPDTVNVSTSTYAPSVAANGDLYFMHPDPTTKRYRLFMSARSGDDYRAPVSLPFSDGSKTDVDPAIAPDESFMVFGTGRHPGIDVDLYITFHQGDRWSEPAYLGDVINSPMSDAEARLAPDGHTLYFSSERVVPVPAPIAPGAADDVLHEMTSWNNGLYNIWSVDIADVIANGRADAHPS